MKLIFRIPQGRFLGKANDENVSYVVFHVFGREQRESIIRFKKALQRFHEV